MRDTIDEVALQRLHRAYADAVTRQVWGELADLFLPDTTVELDLMNHGVRTLVGPEQFGEFVAQSLTQFEFFQFVLLNAHISLREGGDIDRATGRVWMSEHRQYAATGMWSVIYGLYQDHYVRTPEGWRFARRRYQSLARTARGMETFPMPQM
jgi:hypothetical protein